MEFKVRAIYKNSKEELDLITSRAMDTVLETIPEFEGNPDLAHKAFSNFTHEQMSEMFQNTFSSSDHEMYVAEDKQTHQILGHSIFSVKEDEEGKKYGFWFSMYVAPEFRKNGVASALVGEQENWWKSKGVECVLGHTHAKNMKLQSLIKRLGFVLNGPIEGGHFPHYELRKSYEY